jgi:diguanylate cyclase (GGDEF)-like protein
MLEETPGSQTAVDLTNRLEELVVVDLLRDLNAAVGLFEDAANTRQIYMERVQLAAVIATLLILALEIILIFYPAHLTMVGMIGRLRREAWHDPLTGLTNRARFMARVSDMFNDPDKAKRVMVLALDLDGFKAVNDTLGHPVGDQVLKTVAKTLEARLQSETRLGDRVVARFGGDEFMICGYLPSGDLETFCVELGDTLISEIEVPIAVTLGDGRMDRCVVGVSIGYSLSEQTGGNIDIFLSNADIALYESKRRGKGVATAFRRSMRDAAESRHHQTTELKSGIRGMEFLAYFQPQISLEDGKLVGVEALARWHHPERGLIGPDQFIAVAEEFHLIDALDGQIMMDAFQAFQQSRKQGFDFGKLSINASGLALRDPDFCDLLFNVAVGHDIHPSHVTVEILENIFIQEDTDPAIQTLQKLCRAGFGVAIDDFGVGYSSLSRISRGEISAIKIDRSLVRLAGTGNMDSILRATATMAKGINATLLAEGIETEAQRVAMKALGVEVGQGFLWSKPLPISELKQWIILRRDNGLRLVSNE